MQMGGSMSPQPGSWQNPLIVCGERKVLCFRFILLIFTYSFLYLTSAAPAVPLPDQDKFHCSVQLPQGQVGIGRRAVRLVARTEARNLEALGLCPSYVSH